ncbi:MAG: Fur family transcriptional regulator [Candidatus Saccharimonadales bacterium]
MNTDNLARFKQLLASHGHHVTRSRTQVFQLLNQSQPQSIRDILKLSNGSVDRVSLYRTIELFENLGIIHRVHIGWKYKLELTDHFVAHHHHLSCLKCGTIIDIEDGENITSFIKDVVTKYDFSPVRHQFEIQGYCRSCNALYPDPMIR